MKNSTTVKGFIAALLIYSLPFYAGAQVVKKTADSIAKPIAANLRDSLNDTFNWFRKNPPKADGANFLSRWKQTAILDRYGWQITSNTWTAYRAKWVKAPTAAAVFENSNPILYYLHKATDKSIAEIKRTKVKRGAMLWKLYNMGYVVKTKNACFAIDLNNPDALKLINVLDFAIVSHIHGDHNNTEFLDAMVKAGKKVYTPFYKPGTLITATSEFNFGEVNLRFTMNKQADVPVIVSQINCGPAANNYTIYHVGDSRILEDMNPDRKVNLLILHIENAIDVFGENARVKPDITVYDHVMELGHPVGKYRWSYQYVYNKIRNQAPEKSYVLTWGERLEVGTTK